MIGKDEQRQPAAPADDGSIRDRAAVSPAVARLLLSDKRRHLVGATLVIALPTERQPAGPSADRCLSSWATAPTGDHPLACRYSSRDWSAALLLQRPPPPVPRALADAMRGRDQTSPAVYVRVLCRVATGLKIAKKPCLRWVARASMLAEQLSPHVVSACSE